MLRDVHAAYAGLRSHQQWRAVKEARGTAQQEALQAGLAAGGGSTIFWSIAAAAWLEDDDGVAQLDWEELAYWVLPMPEAEAEPEPDPEPEPEA